MQLLNKGDYVLLTRISENDPNVPLFLDNVWGVFVKYTKTGKLEVFAYASKLMKRSGIQSPRMMKTRIVHPENIKLIARKENNRHIDFNIYLGR